MRARVAARKHGDGAAKSIWRNFFGPQSSSTNLRKWLLGGLILLIIVFQLINAPTDFEGLYKKFFSAQTFGHLLALLLAFWIGLKAAALTQSAIYSIDHLNNSQRHILANAFGLFVKEIDLHEENNLEINSIFERVGGPARLIMPMESAAILESSWGSLRSIGPIEERADITGFERVRMLIDLRDQVVDINLSARTKDGVRCSVSGARAVFSIARGKREASLAHPYPFSKQAALRLSRRIENDDNFSDSNNFSALENLIGHHGAQFIEQELQSFIGKFWLGELLATPNAGDPETDNDGNSLFLARDVIRRQFIQHSHKRAIEEGLQINWIDIGTWKVDELAQEILQDYQEENYVHASSTDTDTLEQSKSNEINRLLGELVAIDPQDLRNGDRKNARTKMLSTYLGIIDGLRLRYEDLLDEKDEELTVLLRFLRLLGKRNERK